MDGNSLQSMSPSQKDELMRTVQAQVALANMQEMLSVSDTRDLINLQKISEAMKSVFYENTYMPTAIILPKKPFPSEKI